MIQAIEVSNVFTIHNRLNIRLAPITLLYGEDDVSKQAILRTIELTQKLCRASSRFPLGSNLPNHVLQSLFEAEMAVDRARPTTISVHAKVNGHPEATFEFRIQSGTRDDRHMTGRVVRAVRGTQANVPGDGRSLDQLADTLVSIGSPHLVSGSEYVRDLGRVLSSTAYLGLDFVQRMNDALAKAGINAEVVLEPARDKTAPRALLKQPGSGLAVDVGHAGSGMNHLLQLLAPILAFEEHTFAVHHPEVYKHPALQLALGDILAAAVQPVRGNQFIVDTHSEHLLLRLLRRIRQTREGTLPDGAPRLVPAQVSVICLTSGDAGLIAHHLRVAPNGEFIDRWPNGFFDERMAELF